MYFSFYNAIKEIINSNKIEELLILTNIVIVIILIKEMIERKKK